MKRLIALLLVVLMAVGLFAGCSGKNADEDADVSGGSTDAPNTTDETSQTDKTPSSDEDALRICMITDTGGLGDNGFNDMAWAGMEQARDTFGCEIGIIESSEAAQYASNISAAADQDYDVIILVGFLLQDALSEVAPQYPDTKFIIIDGEVEGDNVYSFKYKMQEASFLAGALSAYVQSDSDCFGVVVGMEIPDCIRWGSGFISGVKAINPNAKVLTAAVGSFADPGKAKELALAQFNQGATAVIEVSSGGAIGVIEAAAESGNKFVATDKSKDDQAPGSELTAALAGRDSAVFTALKEMVEGTDTPGTKVLTMADGVFSVPDYTEERYGAEAAELVETLKQMIVDGEIVVPETYEEANAFPALDLG